ncbi:MAG: O-antigen ligase family protein [Vicinamibacterales bacterium]
MPEGRSASGSEALVWRSLPVRLVLLAMPLALIATVLLFNVGPIIKIIAGVTLAVSFASPAHGLLLTAAVAPLGQLIAVWIGAADFRISEVVVLAFFVGWLLRARVDRPGPRVAAPIAGWLFAATVTGSILGLAWQLRGYPGELPAMIDQIVHGYYFISDRIGVVDGARLLEGFGLAAATLMLFRQRPSLSVTLPAVLTASAAVAAASGVLVWRGAASAYALERYGRLGYRISAHVSDVNAAGSYFAMLMCLALGMAMRDRGYRRAAWCAMAAASGIGLWLSESRSAMAAAAIVLAIAATWVVTGRFPIRMRAVTLAAVLIAALGAGAVRARLLENDPTYRGSGFREQFYATSLRMIAARPLFGIGEGQYYRSSSLFLSPQLAWTYGAENAHNSFLQIGSELGIVGFGLFMLWTGAALARAARSLGRVQGDGRLLGCASGVMVFLGTCLTGHPFLVGEVAYAFWILFGLTAGLAGSALLNNAEPARVPTRARPRAWQIPAAAAAAILVAVPVSAVRGRVVPPESQAVDGFYRWETLADGTRFRWTGGYASVFVPADVNRVEIPVRLPTDGRSIRPMGVEVMIAGVDRGRTLVDSRWAILSLPLPDTLPPIRFKRIDLKVDRVWQPALYIAGSADMRVVGVQVGEPRLFR